MIIKVAIFLEGKIVIQGHIKLLIFYSAKNSTLNFNNINKCF